MTWNESIDAGCKLAGVSFAELARRLGMKSPTHLTRWRNGDTAPSIANFERILDALALSGGYDGRDWWVAKPEDVRLPPAAE